MYDRVLLQAGNLVLDVQLAPLQFDNRQVVRRRMGKRFADPDTGIEVLATKGGAGSLSLDGQPLALKDAKPLPSSD